MTASIRPAFGVALVLVSTLALSQCGGGSPTAPQTTVETVPVATVTTDTPIPNTAVTPDLTADTPPVIPPPGSASTTVNVFGDTGWCGSPALTALPRLLDRFSGDIFLAGDLAYPSGAAEDYRQCFEPTLGRFKPRMRTVPGNHEYVASVTAQFYFDYFGERAGPSRLGYYNFKAGEWNVLMLNSNVPMTKNSAQYNFVRQAMQQTPTRCTLAIMHHPFDSSGLNGPTPSIRDTWELMYNLGADLVIAGHDHLFERFVPVDASQKRDDAKGIRQLTVGTGGASLYNRSRNAPNSEFLVSTYGMLRLQLDPALYQWTFMDMDGNVLDRGLNVCH